MKSIVTAFHLKCVTLYDDCIKTVVHIYICIAGLCCAWFVDEVDLTALVHQPLWTKHTGRAKYLKMHLKINILKKKEDMNWVSLCILDSDVFLNHLCCIDLFCPVCAVCHLALLCVCVWERSSGLELFQPALINSRYRHNRKCISAGVIHR